jgi:hypothetical protein
VNICPKVKGDFNFNHLDKVQSPMKLETLADDPKLIDILNWIHTEPWPRYLNESEIIKKYWRKLYQIYPQYQFLLKENSEYMGLANVFPISWDGSIDGLPEGFDDAIKKVLRTSDTVNALCALAIVVRKKFSGRDLSSIILKHVKKIGLVNGFSNLIIPVRPTLKSKYPLIPMKMYMNWERSGLPFDPWLRTHVKNGGKILIEADSSTVVRGSVSDWQEWTGMYFGDSGDYIVDGALSPIMIDLQNDVGEYIEPNVWMLHFCS